MPATTERPTKNPTKVTKPAPRQDATAVIAELTALLSKYVPPLEVRTDAKGGYHLWSNKPVVIDGRRKKDVYFAGVSPQKGYVGFYYMPVYTNPERKAMFQPELLALLKGKSCFYVRRLDAQLKKQIREALQSGFRLYKQKGWV